MIIVVCTDDDTLTGIARDSKAAHPDIFGHFHNVFTNRIPVLGQEEDLFIIAHGAFKGDEGRPVIGDKGAALYLEARDLYENTKDIFPGDYWGRVFIDACESADSDRNTYSFAGDFHKILSGVLGRNTPVAGRTGTSKGLIALPGDKGWTVFDS